MRRRNSSGRASAHQGIPGLLPPLALRIEFSRPRADVDAILKVRPLARTSLLQCKAVILSLPTPLPYVLKQ
jgi:hypothetical protein